MSGQKSTRSDFGLAIVFRRLNALDPFFMQCLNINGYFRGPDIVFTA